MLVFLLGLVLLAVVIFGTKLAAHWQKLVGMKVWEVSGLLFILGCGIGLFVFFTEEIIKSKI